MNTFAVNKTIKDGQAIIGNRGWKDCSNKAL